MATQDRGSGSPQERRSGRSPFDEIRHVDEDPTFGQFEWWSAREAMPLLGYARWENMANAVRRAKASCRNAGYPVGDHFRDVTKTPPQGGPLSQDTQMSRFGMYLLAMNGDPDKREIAAAQRYFVIQTRRSETELPEPGRSVAPVWRPYSERFTASLRDHRRHIVYWLQPGSFSVLTGTFTDLIVLEDVLLDHFLPLRASDLPDGSVGKRWAIYRRDHGLPEPEMRAPLYLPDRGREVQVKVYAVDEWGSFQGWLFESYFPDHLPEYWSDKFKADRLRLAAHSAADMACLQLTDRPANLPASVRQALTDAGGVVRAPVGAIQDRRRRGIN
jgi:hypothetical protein